MSNIWELPSDEPTPRRRITTTNSANQWSGLLLSLAALAVAVVAIAFALSGKGPVTYNITVGGGGGNTNVNGTYGVTSETNGTTVVLANNQTELFLTLPVTDPRNNNIELTSVSVGPVNVNHVIATFGVGNPGAMAQGYNTTTGTFQFINSGVYLIGFSGGINDSPLNSHPGTASIDVVLSPTPSYGGLFYNVFGCTPGQLFWPPGISFTSSCTPILQVGPQIPLGWYLVFVFNVPCTGTCTNNATYIVDAIVQQIL